MAPAPQGRGHPAASPAPGDHAGEHGTRQRPPRPARQGGGAAGRPRWLRAAGAPGPLMGPAQRSSSVPGPAGTCRAPTDRWPPGAAVQTANGALSRVEQTRRFAILPVSWEPGGDQVTPTVKPKRQAIAARYAQRHRVPARRSLRGGARRRSWPRWPCQSPRAPAEPPAAGSRPYSASQLAW